MSSDDIAIRVTKLSKCYQVYERPQDRLRQAIVPRLRRWFRTRKQVSAASYYREFWALRDVSFEVRRGATMAVVGRNGSGKSTLLQIICGTLTPTEGQVEVRGRVAALLELGAGFNPDFTGRENVFMNAAILGLTREQIEARFSSIAEFADIGEFIEQPIRTYSSGMTVRLAFAVIAHVDADILVVDEALAVGDAFFTQKCMRFMRRFMQTGTILFVSHDTGAVAALCKTAIWLEGGEKRLEDDAKTVADRYLEALIENRQGRGGFVAGSGESESFVAAKVSTVDKKPVGSEPALPARSGDPRLALLNQTQFRNDLEIFSFDPSSEGFGLGVGRITAAQLMNQNEEPVAWVVGGEVVTLEVLAEAVDAIDSPIIGFLVRDRLGQMLFGDNTFFTYQKEPVRAAVQSQLKARFTFTMPILPVGDYSITLSLAEGTQDEHVQHHWIHDGLMFRSHSSSVRHGLVGIPMHTITLDSTTASITEPHS